MEDLRGKLLIASPTLLDPSFFHAVVLVLSHDMDGALGVILNRPSEMPTAEPLPSWSLHSASPNVVFFGGPVSKASGIGLAYSREKAQRQGFAPVFGELGTVDLTLDPDDVKVDAVRVFSGYAGWDLGQIEAEIQEGSWFVASALPGDPFTGDPDNLWNAVLRRQPPNVAMYVNCPPNPSFN